MEVWNVTIAAPSGEIRARLELFTQDGMRVGRMAGKNGSGPAEDLVWTDKRLAWSTKIQKPMPMTLKFNGTIDGDGVAGKVKFGVFASGSFTGKRALDQVATDETANPVI